MDLLASGRRGRRGLLYRDVLMTGVIYDRIIHADIQKGAKPWAIRKG